MKFTNTHIKIFSALFLAVYLQFYFVSIFHIHTFNISEERYFSVQKQVQADPFGSENFCLLNFFSKNLSNKNFFNEKSILIFANDFLILFFNYSDNYNSLKLSSNLLRAPPFYF